MVKKYYLKKDLDEYDDTTLEQMDEKYKKK